jgi:hypothetical protein
MEDQVERLFKEFDAKQGASGSLPALFLLGQIPGSLSKYASRTSVRSFPAGLDDFRRNISVELTKYGLDWESNLLSQFRNSSFNVSRQRMETYLSQFKQLDCLEFGRDLLRLIDIWPQHKILEQLTGYDESGKLINTEEKRIKWMESFDAIVFFDNGLCASSGSVSHLLKTNYGDLVEKKAFTVESLFEKLGGNNKGPINGLKILFIEDGLLTGTEAGRFVNRIKAVQPSFFESNYCLFRFAFGTRYGIIKLESICCGCYISIPGDGVVENLSVDAVARLARNGSLDDRRPPSGRTWTVPQLLSKAREHRLLFPRKRLDHFASFFSALGRELIEPKVHARTAADGWSPADKHAVFPFYNFGWSGLGLTTLFYHSAPAPLVPALRYGGPIKIRLSRKGEPREMDWMPLIERPMSKT